MIALNPNSVQAGLATSTTPTTATKPAADWGKTIGSVSVGLIGITTNILQGVAWRRELDAEMDQRKEDLKKQQEIWEWERQERMQTALDTITRQKKAGTYPLGISPAYLGVGLAAGIVAIYFAVT